MAGFVQGIFFAPEGGAKMQSVQAATALEGCGLEGDRYCAGTGHWSRLGKVCEVTFIAAEDLDDIERETGVGVKNGEHRRNVVTRGISLRPCDVASGSVLGRLYSSIGGRARSAGTSN